MKQQRKILVLGDIHGRAVWKDIIWKENPDMTIFLGDYVSSHEGVPGSDQISNLEEILSFKESHPQTIVLLRGNHDIQHLRGDRNVCAFDTDVFRWFQENKDRFLSDSCWVYSLPQRPDYIFSHAGISSVWMKNCGFESLQDINNSSNMSQFEFWPDNQMDFYGISPTQSPIWIRPQTLLEYGLPHKTFIVGHTGPKGGLCEIHSVIKGSYRESPGIMIWCCDALPDQYLLIELGEEDDNFIIKSVRERHN